MERDINKNQIQKREQEQGISGPLRFFSDDTDFVFVFKKTQKLVSALYLITGFFQDDEPLKWKLRSLGSKLLSSSVLLKDGASSQRDKAVIDIRAYVLEVTALFAVAKQAGMISDMNFEIVNREFSLLLNSVSLSNESYGDNTSDLKEGFFQVSLSENNTKQDVPEDTTVVVPENNNQTEESSLPTILITDKTTSDAETEPKTGLLDEVPATPHMKALETLKGQIDRTEARSDSPRKSESKDLKEYGAVAVKKNSRQSTIISLLKRKREIMIKDVSPLIEGCSEKTIQRELLAMVNLGILKKEGEKRWSRYSLVKTQ